MSDSVIDESDLHFIVKMFKGRVLYYSGFGKKPSIIVCCSEYVAEEQFPKGSVVIAVLGGAIHLGDDSRLQHEDSSVAPRFISQQIRSARKLHPDFPVILVVDVPCCFVSCDPDLPMNVVSQIDLMVNSASEEWMREVTDVSFFLRVNNGAAGGSYYKVDPSLWRLWYENYQVDVLGLHDDVDETGAVEALREINQPLDPEDDEPVIRGRMIDFDPDGPMVADHTAVPDECLDSDVLEAFRESQHDASDDPSRRKG